MQILQKQRDKQLKVIGRMHIATQYLLNSINLGDN